MKRIKKITLRNDFHNTEVNLRVDGWHGFFSIHQRRRSKRALCASHSHCICGDAMGMRGDQFFNIQIEERSDGRVEYWLDLPNQ